MEAVKVMKKELPWHLHWPITSSISGKLLNQHHKLTVHDKITFLNLMEFSRGKAMAQWDVVKHFNKDGSPFLTKSSISHLVKHALDLQKWAKDVVQLFYNGHRGFHFLTLSNPLPNEPPYPGMQHEIDKQAHQGECMLIWWLAWSSRWEIFVIIKQLDGVFQVSPHAEQYRYHRERALWQHPTSQRLGNTPGRSQEGTWRQTFTTLMRQAWITGCHQTAG